MKIQDAAVKVGDLVQIQGPTTGVQEFRIASLRRDEEVPEVAEKGTWVTFPAPRCRVGDKVFLVEPTRKLKGYKVERWKGLRLGNWRIEGLVD